MDEEQGPEQERRLELPWSLFCAFEGAPLILRLYGQGEAVQADDPRFPDLLTFFPAFEAARSIVTVKLDRVQDSCGWAVPFMDFREERDQLKRTWDHRREKMGDELWPFVKGRNATSIDGLPGIE